MSLNYVETPHASLECAQARSCTTTYAASHHVVCQTKKKKGRNRSAMSSISIIPNRAVYMVVQCKWHFYVERRRQKGGSVPQNWGAQEGATPFATSTREYTILLHPFGISRPNRPFSQPNCLKETLHRV